MRSRHGLGPRAMVQAAMECSALNDGVRKPTAGLGWLVLIRRTDMALLAMCGVERIEVVPQAHGVMLTVDKS